jgi:hypothetical protein
MPERMSGVKETGGRPVFRRTLAITAPPTLAFTG